MKTNKLQTIKSKIKRIKSELWSIEEMRPGSLTKQKRSQKKAGSYYQLSYTHKMEGRTEYVRSAFVAEIKQQIATYKRFKKLVEQWVALAIEHSKIKIDIAKSEGEKIAKNSVLSRGESTTLFF